MIGRLTLCIVAAACAGPRAPRAASVIDELARGHGTLETAAPAGSAVAAYRALLRPILGSNCPWLPSDSEFLVRGMRACGVVPSTYAAFARLLEEPDISRSQPSHAIYRGRLRWFDSELRCTR